MAETDMASPIWRCSRGDVNDMLRAQCRACGENRLCDRCGAKDRTSLSVTALRCVTCRRADPDRRETSIAGQEGARRALAACPKCLGSDRWARGERPQVRCFGHDVAPGKELKPVPAVLVPARVMQEAEVPRPCALLSTFLARLGIESTLTYACAQVGSERVETVAVRSRAGAFVYRYGETSWRFEKAIVRTRDGVRSLGLRAARLAVEEWAGTLR